MPPVRNRRAAAAAQILPIAESAMYPEDTVLDHARASLAARGSPHGGPYADAVSTGPQYGGRVSPELHRLTTALADAALTRWGKGEPNLTRSVLLGRTGAGVDAPAHDTYSVEHSHPVLHPVLHYIAAVGGGIENAPTKAHHRRLVESTVGRAIRMAHIRQLYTDDAEGAAPHDSERERDVAWPESAPGEETLHGVPYTPYAASVTARGAERLAARNRGYTFARQGAPLPTSAEMVRSLGYMALPRLFTATSSDSESDGGEVAAVAGVAIAGERAGEGSEDVAVPTYSKELLPQHPARISVMGASGSGKTYWVVEMLLHPDSPYRAVVWVTSARSAEQAKVLQLERDFKGHFKKIAIPVGTARNSDEESRAIEEVNAAVRENKEKGRTPQVIVFDDLMSASAGIQTLQSEMVTTARQDNGSTVEINQRVKTGRKTTLINSNYFAIFEMGDQSDVSSLLTQLEPGKPGKTLLRLYREAVRSTPHAYLFIDRVNKEDPRLRFRFNSMERGRAVDV